MKPLIAAAAAALCLATLPAAAEIVKVPAAGDVPTTMDALEAAVTKAGAHVFTRVDHAGGAAGVGLELGPSQVLIFGNPKLGTLPMQEDVLAGLMLPLKVLVYEDAEGKTWLAYENPADMFAGLDVPADAAYLATMAGALGKLTGAASGM